MQAALLNYLKDWMKNGEAARSEQINLVVAINLTEDRLYLADSVGDWYFRSNHLFEKLSKLREMMSKSPESTSASDLGGYIFELANAAFTLNVADLSLKDNFFLDIVCEKFSIREQNDHPESYKFTKDIVKDNKEIKAYLKSALEKAKELLQARAAGPTDGSENSTTLAGPIIPEVSTVTPQPAVGEASVSVNAQKKKSSFVAPLVKKKKDDAVAPATSKIIPEEPEEKPKTSKKGKDSAQPATNKVAEKSPAPQSVAKPAAGNVQAASTGVATRSAASKKAAPEKAAEAPVPPAPEKSKDKAAKSKDKPVPVPAAAPAAEQKKLAAEEKKKGFSIPVRKDESAAAKPAEPEEEKKPVGKSKDAKKGKDTKEPKESKSNVAVSAPQQVAPQKKAAVEPAPTEQQPAPVEEEKKVQRKSAVRQTTNESREEQPVIPAKDANKITAEEPNPVSSDSRIQDDRIAESQRRSQRRLARTEPQEEIQPERLSFPKIESRKTVLIPGMEAIVKQLQGVCEEPKDLVGSTSTGRNAKSGQAEPNKISLVSELKGYVQKLTELEELRRSALENLIRQIVTGDDEYQKDNQNLLVLLMKSGIVEIEERDASISELTKRYNTSLDFQSKLRIETSLIKNELHENRENLEKLDRRYGEYKDAFRKISEDLQAESAEREDISSRLQKLKQEYDPLKAKYDKIKSLVREWKNKVDVPEMSANMEDTEATGKARRTKNPEEPPREEFSRGANTTVRTSSRPESAQTGALRKKTGWPAEAEAGKQKHYEEINDEEEVDARPLGKRRVVLPPRPAEASRYVGGSSSYRPAR